MRCSERHALRCHSALVQPPQAALLPLLPLPPQQRPRLCGGTGWAPEQLPRSPPPRPHPPVRVVRLNTSPRQLCTCRPVQKVRLPVCQGLQGTRLLLLGLPHLAGQVTLHSRGAQPASELDLEGATRAAGVSAQPGGAVNSRPGRAHRNLLGPLPHGAVLVVHQRRDAAHQGRRLDDTHAESTQRLEQDVYARSDTLGQLALASGC